MNNRIAALPENSYAAEVKQLQVDLQELKSRQSIPRSLIGRAYITTTSNTWDINGVSVAANSIRSFLLIFSADHTQTWPYGVQYSQVYNGGTDAGHRLSDYQQLDATGTLYNWLTYSVGNSQNTVGWQIVVSAGPTGATVYIKGRTMTTCKGSFTLS